MKDDLGKDSILAVCIAVVGTLLLNANTLIATFRNNRAKDRETDAKKDEGIRDDLFQISEARRVNWQDCESRLKDTLAENKALQEQLKASEEEKKPLRRRAERFERSALSYEETLIANKLLSRISDSNN